MNDAIKTVLMDKGVHAVRFVDISSLPQEQTLGHPKAILVCVALSREFILSARDGVLPEEDEFVTAEHYTDELGDWLAAYLQQAGYCALSQSERSNEQNNRFDNSTQSSRLPHKTVARLAGFGFIGKNNLLISTEYGCAFSMCTVLTDAPVVADRYPILESKCGACRTCQTVCPTGAIYGETWSPSRDRDEMVDVNKCTCPLKCMVHCPYTLRYAQGSPG